MSRLSVPVLALLLTASAAVAQQPSPLSVPNPAAPVLAMTGPMGMQRGTTLELTLTGTNLANPTGLWTSFPAKVTIPKDNNNGTDAAKLRVVLEVPADAPLGTHSIRVATTRGLSNLRLFCIDDLPQVLETDQNRSKATAQPVTAPCVVIGRADAEVADYFKVSVKAGQRLSFDVLGHRLGSAFDPQLVIYDAKTGREVPGGLSNDAPGCQTDPRLTMTFKADGDYLVEVRDTSWRGGPDFIYRLRIGDFPLATTPLPMAVKRGAKVSLQFAGPQVEGVAAVEVTAPTDPTVDTVWVAPKGPSGLYGWPVAVAVSDTEEVLEQEPNNDPAKPQRVTVPCGITGRLLEKGDIDHYAFAATKGQRLIIEAQTQELYSPTEVYMVLKDAKGGQVAVTNPMQAPRIDFTAPADGDYVLSVEHLLSWHGPAETYRVQIAPYEPGFSLGLFLDRYDAPQGAPLSIPVSLAARRDYAGPIEVSIIGPPGITGTATIPANAAVAPPPPAPAPAAAMIPVTVAPDVGMGPYTVVVRGKAVINGKEVVEYASARAVISQNLGGLMFPPRQLNTQVGLAVTEKPPFLISAKFEPADVLLGGASTLTVTATKGEGFDEDIVIALVGTPANVALAPKNIAKGQTEVKLEVKPAANAALGSFPITVNGKAKFQGRDVSVNSAGVPLVVTKPFDLTVEGAPVKVEVGKKANFKVTAVRKGGYMGPIALEVKNLPAGVTEAKAEIAMGQTSVEVELTAAENAAVGDKADVNVVGTAPAAANQQNPSANFTVSVIKK